MIKADEVNSIIEPYFDGGDSYTNHHKYSYILRYSYNGGIDLSQGWDSGVIRIMPNGEGTLERKIREEDISDFDMLTLKMTCPKEVKFTVCINGETIFDEYGTDMLDNYKAPINQNTISEISYHFENETDEPRVVNLYYLGVMKDRKTEPLYKGDWEGCIEEEMSFVPYDNDVFMPGTLEKIRQGLSDEKMRIAYENEQKTALEALEVEPEQFISKTTGAGFRKGGPFLARAEALAFVGMTEKNTDMIRMACRYALSMAACSYWCSDIMEEIPNCTWHHRSFDEKDACDVMSRIISICGNSLTWHGRNILYQALIMKGLPRIEADFMTMDYIYKMNQGLAFLCGYVKALICLSHQYPRYEKRIAEAEDFLSEMLENAQNSDGSTDEGAGYWQYTFWSALKSIEPLARHRGMSLKEYIGEKFEKTSEFGLFLLDKSGKTLPYNDAGAGYYIPYMSKCFYMLTGDERWAKAYNRSDCKTLGIDNILYDVEVPDKDCEIRKEYNEFKDVGLVGVCRDDIQLLCVSGKSNVTHCHADKGSFMLYLGETPLLTDCTNSGGYGSSAGAMIYETRFHNAAMPVSDGREMCQNRGENVKAEYSCKYENGIFDWTSDQTNTWGCGIVKKNTRRIYSETADKYVITDMFEFGEPMSIKVNFWIKNEDLVEVIPISEYENIEYVEALGMKRMIITSKKAQCVTIVSEVKIKRRKQ